MVGRECQGVFSRTNVRILVWACPSGLDWIFSRV